MFMRSMVPLVGLLLVAPACSSTETSVGNNDASGVPATEAGPDAIVQQPDGGGQETASSSDTGAASTDGATSVDGAVVVDGTLPPGDGASTDGVSTEAGDTGPVVVVDAGPRETKTLPCPANIDAPTVLTRAVYIVDCNVNVRSSLTIEPGVILKFTPDKRFDVDDVGTLRALATAADPIIFTSVKDDAHGGDTNKDGNVSTPSKGDWGCNGACGAVNVGGNGSQLDHVHVYYGTNGLQVQAGSVSVKNSVFAHHQEIGLVLDNRYDVGTTTLTGNTLFDNDEYPLQLGKLVSLDASNIFHDPSNPTITNGKQCIAVGSQDVTKPISWSVTELGFLANLDIRSSLTLAPGVILKSDIGESVSLAQSEGGTLIGGQGAFFTSLKDDAHGGDCSGDGATPPTAADWSGISVTPTNGDWYWASGANILYASEKEDPARPLP